MCVCILSAFFKHFFKRETEKLPINQSCYHYKPLNIEKVKSLSEIHSSFGYETNSHRINFLIKNRLTDSLSSLHVSTYF